MGALTTIDVHNRDVVAKMVDLGTCEVGDFEWMSQLRYYWYVTQHPLIIHTTTITTTTTNIQVK